MKQTKGFTLVELMIVVAIIGIISAVAIPQYKQYVVRGNRVAAQAFMMDIANREKQYLLDARSYTANWAIAAPAPTLGMAIPNDVSKNYNITICLDSASADAMRTSIFIARASQAAHSPAMNDHRCIASCASASA